MVRPGNIAATLLLAALCAALWFAPSPQVSFVQEGETLGMIALKYYGRKSAWIRIQDANKAKVSSDGNVKAGVVLDIP